VNVCFYIGGSDDHHYLRFLYITVCICNEQIGGVMVSVIASRVVDCWFEPRSGHTKHYAIGICCFSAKHTTLSRKSKGCLLRNEDNVSA
jgi:hypothetical protein